MHNHDQFDDTSRGFNAMTGFMLGAVLGAGLALMLAPASGEETRRRIGSTARRVKDEAVNRFGEARTTISEIKEDAKSAIQTGRETFSRNRQSRGDKQTTDSYQASGTGTSYQAGGYPPSTTNVRP